MHYLKKYLTYSLLLLSSATALLAKTPPEIVDQPIAFEHAITITNQGVLKQKENGYVYLDVDNDFIDQIVPLIETDGQLRPLPTSKKSRGAHISVFHEKEGIIPFELGKTFTFTVDTIRKFTLSTRDGFKKLWVIAVISPELEDLRAKYGCKPKLQGNDFHITLGKQLPTAPDGWDKVESISRLNYLDEPYEGLYKSGDFKVVTSTDVFPSIEKISQIGQLCLKSNGFVYLNVENAFIDNTVNKLPLKHAFKQVSTKPKSMGAHISIIDENEMVSKEIWHLQEAGEWFTFEVKELRYFERVSSDGVKRTWLLAVESPGLENLRKRYGLKPKMKGHDFHITLGSELEEAECKMLQELKQAG